MAIKYDYWNDKRKFSPDEIRMAVNAIKRSDAYGAIECLQRAFGHNTAMVELIENEWRRK